VARAVLQLLGARGARVRLVGHAEAQVQAAEGARRARARLVHVAAHDLHRAGAHHVLAAHHAELDGRHRLGAARVGGGDAVARRGGAQALLVEVGRRRRRDAGVTTGTEAPAAPATAATEAGTSPAAESTASHRGRCRVGGECRPGEGVRGSPVVQGGHWEISRENLRVAANGR